MVTPDTQGSLHTCLGSFLKSLISDDFWWISGVLVCTLEESASHPLSSAGYVSQVMHGRVIVIGQYFFVGSLLYESPQQLLG